MSSSEERLMLLQQENDRLKKSNAEKSDAVKKMGVQLTRIRNDWQQSAAPKDLVPVAKARAAAEVSKADRISELQVELSQRDAREERLRQQLMLLKQQVGTGSAGKVGGPGRPMVTRVRRPVRPHSASTGYAPHGSSEIRAPPVNGATSARGTAASAEGIGGGGGGGGGGLGGSFGDRMGSLLQMLGDKDKAIEEVAPHASRFRLPAARARRALFLFALLRRGFSPLLLSIVCARHGACVVRSYALGWR